MFDAGIRIVSLVFVSGILLFLTFFLWSLLYARKASAANPLSIRSAWRATTAT